MTDPDREIWGGMLAHLRRHHPTLCRHWFSELEHAGIDEGSVYVRADSEVRRDYLRRECVQAFVEAAQSETESLIGVRFLGPDEHAPDRAPGRGAGERSAGVVTDGAAEVEAKPGPRGAESSLRMPPPLPTTRGPIRYSSSESAAQPSGTIFLNPDYVFDNFIIGEGNRWAYAASVAVARTRGGRTTRCSSTATWGSGRPTCSRRSACGSWRRARTR
jgi:chromosomal replication initiation ATPase DnaA